MKVFACNVLAVLITTCSAAFIGGYGGRNHEGGSFEVIQSQLGPTAHQEVKTFHVIQQQDSGYGQQGKLFKVFVPQAQHQPHGVKYVKLLQEQPTEHIKNIQFGKEQQPAKENVKTIQVIHKHPAEHFKEIQIVHKVIQKDPGTADGSGETNFGDAFETLKSLKVYGAFEGNGDVVDSYGSPIVRTWHQL